MDAVGTVISISPLERIAESPTRASLDERQNVRRNWHV
jgi:hypothetical protein